MRASTLFAIAVALLIGLGGTIFVKLSGILNPPAPPPPPEPPAATPIVQLPSILVAAQNHFAGDTLQPPDVRIRTMHPEEYTAYMANPSKYITPVVEAAVLRTPKVNLFADQPILLEHLEEMVKPDGLNARLIPNTRPVSVYLEKSESVAGMIAVGDWVDVFITCDIDNPGEPPTTRTALLASHALLIAKRDTLWNTFAPLPSGPLQHTLAVNPYRAALIEYARARGKLSIVPVSKTEKQTLETLKKQVTEHPDRVAILGFEDPSSTEYLEESKRIQEYLRGILTVGQADLVRIFDLKAVPPKGVAAAARRIEIDAYVGLKNTKVSFAGPKTESVAESLLPTYQFSIPQDKPKKKP